MFQISSTTPITNAESVLIGSTIQIEFNNDLDPKSINDLVVSVGVADSSPFQSVDGRTALLATNSIEFTPAIDLANNVKYVVVVAGGEFGVKSITGRKLANDYLFYFTTEVAAGGAGDPEVPDEDPTDGIPLESSINLLSSKVSEGKIELTFDTSLSDDTEVTITSRHPLGRQGGLDFWKSFCTITVNGYRVTINPGHGLLSLDYEQKLVNTTLPTYVLLESSVPVLEYTVGAENIDALFDFAVNREYTITISDETTGSYYRIVLVQPHVGPEFVTVDEAKLRLSALTTVFETDDRIRLMIYLESLRAYNIWMRYGVWPGYVPYYASEYVMVRLTIDAIEQYAKTTAVGGSPESFSLGDLKITMPGQSSSSLTGFGDVIDIQQLRNMEYILGEKLRKNDVSTKPIYEPDYSLMAPEHGSGVIALTPSVGRRDPTTNPDLDRALYPNRHSRHGRFNP